MLINALTIGLESTLDNNIMADAVMRDKFAQTLTFIFLIFEEFLFPPPFPPLFLGDDGNSI